MFLSTVQDLKIRNLPALFQKTIPSSNKPAFLNVNGNYLNANGDSTLWVPITWIQTVPESFQWLQHFPRKWMFLSQQSTEVERKERGSREKFSVFRLLSITMYNGHSCYPCLRKYGMEVGTLLPQWVLWIKLGSSASTLTHLTGQTDIHIPILH